MEKPRELYKINSLWSIFGLLSVLILFNSLSRSFNHDEFEAIHSAWKILHGERIYIDFFQHHHSLFYYLLALIIAVFKENIFSIIVMRLLIFCMLSLIFAIVYYIAKIFVDKKGGIITLILLATTSLFFIERVIEIRPDVPQTLFGILAVSHLFAYFENRSLKFLIPSAFSLGLSFLFLQKTIFLVLIIEFLLCYEVYAKQIHTRDVLIYNTVFVGIVMPYYLYLQYSNSFYRYMVFNWIINMKHISHYSPLKHLNATFLTSSTLWFFWLLSLFFLKRPAQKRMGILSIGLLTSTFFMRLPHPQNFMMAMPFVAILSANVISLLITDTKILLLVLAIAMIIPTYELLLPALKIELNNCSQLEKIDYVLSHTTLNDFVYDGDINFNVFRKDLDFFWFSMHEIGMFKTFKILYKYDYDIYGLIDKYKPKIISTNYIDIRDPRISLYYTRSAEYSDLFLRNN